MLFELTDFIDCGLRCRARAVAGSVAGFVLDGDDWALPYVLVRLDHDPLDAPRLLPTAAFPPVQAFDGHLTGCLTPDEFARGLALTGDCEALTRDSERTLHDALHWMPYWTESAEDTPCTLHDASRVLGAPLTCCGEPFGRVEDLLVDTQTWTVTALCIQVSGGDGNQRLHLPPSFIRAAHWSRPGFDSDVRAAVLACAPPADRAVPDSDYFDHLRQHLAGK